MHFTAVLNLLPNVLPTPKGQRTLGWLTLTHETSVKLKVCEAPMPPCGVALRGAQGAGRNEVTWRASAYIYIYIHTLYRNGYAHFQ